MIITKEDLVGAHSFFTGTVGVREPERIDVATYILGIGIARSLNCGVIFNPLMGLDATTGWRHQIGKHEHGGRFCTLCIVYAEARDKRGGEQKLSVTLDLQVQHVPNELRKWFVGFGEYAGVVDMDEPEALDRFYKFAAEEVLMRTMLAPFT